MYWCFAATISAFYLLNTFAFRALFNLRSFFYLIMSEQITLRPNGEKRVLKSSARLLLHTQATKKKALSILIPRSKLPAWRERNESRAEKKLGSLHSGCLNTVETALRWQTVQRDRGDPSIGAPDSRLESSRELPALMAGSVKQSKKDFRWNSLACVCRCIDWCQKDTRRFGLVTTASKESLVWCRLFGVLSELASVSSSTHWSAGWHYIDGRTFPKL